MGSNCCAEQAFSRRRGSSRSELDANVSSDNHRSSNNASVGNDASVKGSKNAPCRDAAKRSSGTRSPRQGKSSPPLSKSQAQKKSAVAAAHANASVAAPSSSSSPVTLDKEQAAGLGDAAQSAAGQEPTGVPSQTIPLLIVDVPRRRNRRTLSLQSDMQSIQDDDETAVYEFPEAVTNSAANRSKNGNGSSDNTKRKHSNNDQECSTSRGYYAHKDMLVGNSDGRRVVRQRGDNTQFTPSTRSHMIMEDLCSETLQVSASTTTDGARECDIDTAVSLTVDVSQPTQSILIDRAGVSFPHGFHALDSTAMRTLSDLDAMSDLDTTFMELSDLPLPASSNINMHHNSNNSSNMIHINSSTSPINGVARFPFTQRDRERQVMSNEAESRLRLLRLMRVTKQSIVVLMCREQFTLVRLDMLQLFFLERSALLLQIIVIHERWRRQWLEREAEDSLQELCQRSLHFPRCQRGTGLFAATLSEDKKRRSGVATTSSIMVTAGRKQRDGSRHNNPNSNSANNTMSSNRENENDSENDKEDSEEIELHHQLQNDRKHSSHSGSDEVQRSPPWSNLHSYRDDSVERAKKIKTHNSGSDASSSESARTGVAVAVAGGGGSQMPAAASVVLPAQSSNAASSIHEAVNGMSMSSKRESNGNVSNSSLAAVSDGVSHGGVHAASWSVKLINSSHPHPAHNNYFPSTSTANTSNNNNNRLPQMSEGTNMSGGGSEAMARSSSGVGGGASHVASTGGGSFSGMAVRANEPTEDQDEKHHIVHDGNKKNKCGSNATGCSSGGIGSDHTTNMTALVGLSHRGGGSSENKLALASSNSSDNTSNSSHVGVSYTPRSHGLGTLMGSLPMMHGVDCQQGHGTSPASDGVPRRVSSSGVHNSCDEAPADPHGMHCSNAHGNNSAVAFSPLPSASSSTAVAAGSNSIARPSMAQHSTLSTRELHREGSSAGSGSAGEGVGFANTTPAVALIRPVSSSSSSSYHNLVDTLAELHSPIYRPRSHARRLGSEQLPRLSGEATAAAIAILDGTSTNNGNSLTTAGDSGMLLDCAVGLHSELSGAAGNAAAGVDGGSEHDRDEFGEDAQVYSPRSPNIQPGLPETFERPSSAPAGMRVVLSSSGHVPAEEEMANTVERAPHMASQRSRSVNKDKYAASPMRKMVQSSTHHHHTISSRE